MYTRMFLYITIAVTTAVAAETSNSILPKIYAVTLAGFLQGLIAWRAFIDETPAQVRQKKEDEKMLKAMSTSNRE